MGQSIFVFQQEPAQLPKANLPFDFLVLARPESCLQFILVLPGQKHLFFFLREDIGR